MELERQSGSHTLRAAYLSLGRGRSRPGKEPFSAILVRERPDWRRNDRPRAPSASPLSARPCPGSQCRVPSSPKPTGRGGWEQRPKACSAQTGASSPSWYPMIRIFQDTLTPFPTFGRAPFKSGSVYMQTQQDQGFLPFYPCLAGGAHL